MIERSTTAGSPTTNIHSMSSGESPPAYAQIAQRYVGEDRLANLKMISALQNEYQKIRKSKFLAHSPLSICLSLLSNAGLLKQAAQMDSEMLEYTMWMVHSNLVATFEGLHNSEVIVRGAGPGCFIRQVFHINKMLDSDNHRDSKVDDLALECTILCGVLISGAYLSEISHLETCEWLDDHVLRMNANQVFVDVLATQFDMASIFETPATFSTFAHMCIIGVSSILSTTKVLESGDSP